MNPTRTIFEAEGYRVVVEHLPNALGRFAVSVCGQGWAIATSVERPEQAELAVEAMLAEHEDRKPIVAGVKRRAWER